jgi:phage gp36-like protein
MIPDPFGPANNITRATIDYMIEKFGIQEMIELSNIDNATGNTLNPIKIQAALNDAEQLIINYIDTAPPQAKILIAGSFRHTQATIARYYLDVLRPRTHVMEAAEKALQQLESWAAKSTPTSGLKWREAYRYWQAGNLMTRSSFARPRQYTSNSLEFWRNRWGTNNKFDFRSNYPEAPLLNYPVVGQPTTPLEIQNEQINRLGAINELVDALDSTLSLANFTDTEKLENASDNDRIAGDTNSAEFDKSSQPQNNDWSLGGEY